MTFPELRQLCEGDYPPDIARNLDIIFRTVLDPVVADDRDSPLAQMKFTFMSRFLLEYTLMRHRCDPSTVMQPRRRGTPTAILALLYPYRPDYHALVFPVTNELAERGVRTTVLTRRRHFRPSVDPALFHGAPFLFEEDFYSLDAYRRARKRYSRLIPWLHRLSAQLHLSADQERSLKILYQNHYFQREAFAKILDMVRPSVVFGLHFILNPGFLSAIDEIPSETERPVKLLIQHGFFRSGVFHDFKGADCVLLWGQYSEAVLRSGFIIPVPASRVLGNPKLAFEMATGQMRMDQSVSTHTRLATKEILFVSTVDTPGHEYHSKAARLLAKSIQACPSSWHALYRPHPTERMYNYDRLVEDGLISPCQITPRFAGIYDLMRRADVVCGGNSTALLEAAAMGTPVIQMLPEMSGTDWCQHGMTGASSEQELRDALQAILTDPQGCRNVLASQQRLVDSMFATVAGSSQNIADYIMNLVAQDSRTRSGA